MSPIEYRTMFVIEPARWTFAQSGTTRSAVSSETPFLSVWRSVTGIVAADEQQPKPVK